MNINFINDARNISFPYKFIDLTHTLDANVPNWDGDCGFKHDIQVDYTDCAGEDKFRVMQVNMHAGIGTHIDAPSHCIQGGKCVNDFDVNDLCMPCVVIDVSHKCHERYTVNIDDITEFESVYGVIPNRACVMIRTGWSKFWYEPEKYHNNHIFPSVSAFAANLLLQRDVSALGIDTLSPDRPEDGFKVHQAFLGAGKILIENAANLDKMPTTNAFIIALPIKIQDGTEAPIRLVGLIPSMRSF